MIIKKSRVVLFISDIPNVFFALLQIRDIGQDIPAHC